MSEIKATENFYTITVYITLYHVGYTVCKGDMYIYITI